MAARKKVWDLFAEGGPIEIEMFAVDADEAVKNDPDRYTFFAPEGTVQAEAAQREQEAVAERNRLASEEEAAIRAADQEAQQKRREIEAAEREERKKKAQDERDEAAKNPSSQGKLQQIERERDQKQAKAREDRAAAESDLAKGASMPRSNDLNRLTTTTLPGPVPNRAGEQMENQIPAGKDATARESEPLGPFPDRPASTDGVSQPPPDPTPAPTDADQAPAPAGRSVKAK